MSMDPWQTERESLAIIAEEMTRVRELLELWLSHLQDERRADGVPSCYDEPTVMRMPDWASS